MSGALAYALPLPVFRLVHSTGLCADLFRCYPDAPVSEYNLTHDYLHFLDLDPGLPKRGGVFGQESAIYMRKKQVTG